MQKSLATQNKNKIYFVILFQGGMSLCMAMSFLMMFGMQDALDAFLGGIVAFVPNFVFASMTFAFSGACQLDKIIRFFYWGEALKILLTITLFTLVFMTREIRFTAFFVSYAVVVSMHGLVFLISNNDK